MRTLQAMAHEVEIVPDRQISLTDLDARARARNGRCSGVGSTTAPLLRVGRVQPVARVVARQSIGVLAGRKTTA